SASALIADQQFFVVQPDYLKPSAVAGQSRSDLFIEDLIDPVEQMVLAGRVDRSWGRGRGFGSGARGADRLRELLQHFLPTYLILFSPRNETVHVKTRPHVPDGEQGRGQRVGLRRFRVLK